MAVPVAGLDLPASGEHSMEASGCCSAHYPSSARFGEVEAGIPLHVHLEHYFACSFPSAGSEPDCPGECSDPVLVAGLVVGSAVASVAYSGFGGFDLEAAGLDSVADLCSNMAFAYYSGLAVFVPGNSAVAVDRIAVAGAVGHTDVGSSLGTVVAGSEVDSAGLDNLGSVLAADSAVAGLVVVQAVDLGAAVAGSAVQAVDYAADCYHNSGCSDYDLAELEVLGSARSKLDSSDSNLEG